MNSLNDKHQCSESRKDLKNKLKKSSIKCFTPCESRVMCGQVACTGLRLGFQYGSRGENGGDINWCSRSRTTGWREEAAQINWTSNPLVC